MISSVFIIKLLVSVFVVIVLSIIAERVNPKIAGILAGCPTGTAIALFFFGLEISPKFASDSALYNMIGFVGTLSFIYIYYKSSILFKKYTIILSSLVSIISYFLIAYLLHFIKTNIVISILVPIISILIFLDLFKEIEDTQIKHKIKLGYKVLFMRALVAASVLILITELAKMVGPVWAGLFSTFPTTIFPLLLIVSITYGVEASHTIIKNVPIGLVSVVFYSLTVSFTYTTFGIYIGTLIAFVIAILYLVSYTIIKEKIKPPHKIFF